MATSNVKVVNMKAEGACLMVTLMARTVVRRRMLTVFMGRRIRRRRKHIWGRVERRAPSRPINHETSRERAPVREIRENKKGVLTFLVGFGDGYGFIGTNQVVCCGIPVEAALVLQQHKIIK